MKTSPRVIRFIHRLLVSSVLIGSASAANVAWDGDIDPNASGTWETGVNWNPDGVPGVLDNAQLLDVTTGTRTVTISSGFPQTINKLSVIQTTLGAFNILNLDDDLTISLSGNNSPFAMAATAGQSSIVTNIADGKTLLATNSTNAMAGTLFDGTLNLGAASTFRLEALGAASDLVGATFGGPINATGAGASLVLQSGRFVQNPVFNGAITVSNPASTLTVSVLSSLSATAGVGGALTFNGNDGSGNAVNLAAGTGLIFNVLGSTFNFTNRVNLAAESSPDSGGAITFGALTGTGSQTVTTNFNGGLVLGAGAVANFYSPSVSTNLAGTSSLATGAIMLLKTDNPQSAWNLTNNGIFTMDGGVVNFDWAASGNNNPSNTTLGRRFVNTGTWTLKNSASIAFVSSTGRPVTGGFGVGTNNENSGTFNLESGSKIGFLTFFNTGTMNLGSSNAGVSDATVYLGSPDDTFASVTLVNGLTAPTPTSSDLAGTVNILGNTWLGRTTDIGGVTTLQNGSATSTDSVINVGNGVVTTKLTVANRTVAINNFAGNTLNVNAGGTLLLSSTATYSATGNVALINDGTLTHTGDLLMQGTFNGTRSVTTSATGVYRINGTQATLEAHPAAAGTQVSNVAAVTFSVAGLLVGYTSSDTLTYNNSTGNSSRDTMDIGIIGGEVAPGNGTAGSGILSVGKLELANINLTTSDTSLFSFDIGGTTASDLFDSISLTGRGGIFTLSGSNDTLDIRIVNSFADIAPQTYLLVGANSRVGTFDSLLFNGIAVTNEYTVNYLANGIEITLAASVIPEPSTALLLIGGLGAMALLRQRKPLL